MNGIQGPCLGTRRDWIGSDTAIWDRFWQAGRRASCYQGEDGRYLPAIRDRWWTYFRELGDPVRLLDLGTGNGALAEEVARFARAVRPRAWALDAIDVAEIRPPAISGPGLAVRFHPRTDCRDLPFDAHGFNALAAQFTLEYLPLGECLPELARVLRPGGRLRAMCHVSGGVSERLARRELAEIDAIVRIGLMSRTRSVVMNPTAGSLAELAEVAESLIREHAPTALLIPLILNNLEHLYGDRELRGTEAVLAAMDRVEEEMMAHRQRLLWLVEAAIDVARREAMAAALQGAGFRDLRFDRVMADNGALLAIQLDANR